MQAVFILKHLLKKNIFSYFGGLYALCEESHASSSESGIRGVSCEVTVFHDELCTSPQKSHTLTSFFS